MPPHSYSHTFQSTLPAWGATNSERRLFQQYDISIHAPRMGSDKFKNVFLSKGDVFQSTLPAWGATDTDAASNVQERDFNPRSPHGERPARWPDRLPPSYFNPRSPHGERQLKSKYKKVLEAISIHAPRMGSDLNDLPMKKMQMLFQSTLPAWGATILPWQT